MISVTTVTEINIAAENQWLEDLLILLSFWGYVSFLGAVKHHKKAKTKKTHRVSLLSRGLTTP